MLNPRAKLPPGIARAEEDDFAASVLDGLSRPHKTLPCRFFYDARGSELFEEITRLPEYYPTRTETAILQAHAAEMAEGRRPAASSSSSARARASRRRSCCSSCRSSAPTCASTCPRPRLRQRGRVWHRTSLRSTYGRSSAISPGP